MRKIVVIMIVAFCPVFAWSQDGSITGTLYNKSNSEAVAYGSILLQEINQTATTDENGLFAFTKLKPGEYTIIAAGDGIKRTTLKVTVKKGDVARALIYAEAEDDGATQLEGVDIDAQGSLGSKTQVRTSVVTATKKNIDAVPTVGGQSDIATYFQTVPGVTTTGDQGGQMYVRGGAPIQNKVMLDGMVIYNPFHSIGFFSVFDTDIIKTADIYTGGYNAEHGGRISSVMDISTRDGNKQETDGKISVSPFGAKVLLEGPIGSKKNRAAEGAKLSYLISGKTSYLAQSSKIFYNYVNKDGNGLPFNYTDLYGKFSANTGNGSKFNLFGFNFTDSVTYQTISKLKWNTYGGGTNFVLLLPGSPVLTEGHFAYSKYEITLDDQTNTPRFSSISSFNGGFDFKYYLKKNEIKYGLEVLGYSTSFQFANSAGLNISQVENTSEIAAYLTYKITAGRLLIEPGFRAHYYASLRDFSPEPRLGLKFNFTDEFRMKASGGIYSQNLIAANSDRDVVNLFYGFLSGSSNLPSTYTSRPDGQEVERVHALQKAIHSILGFEYDLNTRLTFNIEGYYKRFTQLSNLNRNKIYNADDPTKPDITKLDYAIETGDAYGVDFLAKYSTKKTYLWFVYSLGKVTRWDGIQEYAPVWDRRHNINIVATQKLGKNKKRPNADAPWEVSLRWNFGSGLPFTPTKGVYAKPAQGGVAVDPITGNPSTISYIYGDLNSKRLPTYHRLDLTVKRTFEFFKTIKGEDGAPDRTKMTSRLEINAGATNVYNRDNVFYVERSTNTVVNQLPIIPSIGINYEF